MTVTFAIAATDQDATASSGIGNPAVPRPWLPPASSRGRASVASVDPLVTVVTLLMLVALAG